MRNKLIVGLACAASLGLWAHAAAQGTLKSVSVDRSSGSFDVKISGEGLAKPKTLRVSKGRDYILHFNGKLAGKAGKLNVNEKDLSYVRWTWYKAKPPMVSVHMRVAANAKPTLVKTEEGWTVSFGEAVAVAEKVGDKFPEKVPPLTSPAKVAFEAKTVAEKPAEFFDPTLQRVTLDFSNTEVVQILKALALQANVNIVTAPSVSGKLTVAMSNVPLREALDLVTTMAGLRYAQISNTYIVAGSNDLTRAVREMVNRGGVQSVTKVVPLTSKSASYVREATLKTMPQTSKDGWYEILFASEWDGSALLASAEQANGQANAAGGAQNAPAQQGNNGSTAAAGATDTFLVVVGDARRVSNVVRYMQELDGQLMTSQFPDKKDLKTVAIPVYSGDPDRLTATLAKLVSTSPRAGDYSISKTKVAELTTDDGGSDVIVFTGPEAEMSHYVNVVKVLDEDLAKIAGIQVGENGVQRMYEVVELQYVDPTETMHDLSTRIRGLQVSLMPETVSPLSETLLKPADAAAAAGPGGAAGGASGGGVSPSTERQLNEDRLKTGAEQSTTGDKFEKKSRGIPMKLMLRGTSQQIAEARRYLALVDVAPRSVALEMRVMELTREEAQRFGIDWSILTGGAVRSVRLNQSLGGAQNTASGAITGRGWRVDITAELDEMASKGRLISRPNLLAMDGRLSRIFIGDRVPYIVSRSQSTTGEVNIQLDTVDAGVLLNVLPRIGAREALTLSLAMDVSSILAFIEVPGGGRVPRTTNRQAEMTINMDNGDTIAIGGLIQEQETRNMSKVPILGDLPIVGQLFRSHSNSKVRTEVVIFLTARVVNNGNERDAANPLRNERANPAELGSGRG